MKSIYKSILLLTLSTLILFQTSYSQFNWNTVDDSITLNPTIYSVGGTVAITFLGKIISEDNMVYVDFKNKNVYVNNFNNFFKFPFDQVEKIYTNDGDDFYGNNLSESEFKGKLINGYRKLWYNNLDLNLITFTYSKKNKVAITKDGRLYIKNEKQIKGKICSVGLDFVVILTEDGELLSMSDGDFISFTTSKTTAKNCRTLYNLIFNDFKKELSRKINNWEDSVLTMDLNTLINDYGPLNSVKEINSELKQYEWKWPRITYRVNISTESRQLGISNFTRTTNYYGNTTSSVYGSVGSSLFLYGNSYRTANSDGSLSGISGSVTNVSQNGTISMSDEGASITVVKNTSGKSISLQHNSIFSELDYGKPFKFIEY